MYALIHCANNKPTIIKTASFLNMEYFLDEARIYLSNYYAPHEYQWMLDHLKDNLVVSWIFSDSPTAQTFHIVEF